MASSGSGDDEHVFEPSKKKRKSAEAAEENVHHSEEFSTDRAGADEREVFGHEEIVISGERKRSGAVSKVETPHDVRLGEGDEEEFDDRATDDLADEDIEGETGGELVQLESTSTRESSGQEQRRQEREYQDFTPPAFLQTVVGKRRRELENIRRELPVDNRSGEQKLADWYSGLSKLDKPVALLSLISPPSSHHP